MNTYLLNRNFLGPREEYSGAAETYRPLDPFLNPPRPPSRDFFGLRAAGLVLRHGVRALTQAIAGGQYEYPRGLFFGGRRLEPGSASYQEWIARQLASARRVFAIDVHTGLGRPGEDMLMVEDVRLGCELRVPVVGPAAGGKVAYRARGSLDRMLVRSLPNARVDFVCQEFGTVHPMQVLHALREENRWHHFGRGDVDHPSKRNLKLAFCRNEKSWRESVLERGLTLWKRAVEVLLGE